MVADTDNRDEAIRIAAEHRPHVAVFDAQLGGHHFKALRRFHDSQPTVKIVAFSKFELGPSAAQLDRLGVTVRIREHGAGFRRCGGASGQAVPWCSSPVSKKRSTYSSGGNALSRSSENTSLPDTSSSFPVA